MAMRDSFIWFWRSFAPLTQANEKLSWLVRAPHHLKKMLDRGRGLMIGRGSGRDECFNIGPDMLALVDGVAGQ